MGYDYARSVEKEKEIQDEIISFLLTNDLPRNHSQEISALILKSAIKITPPEKQEHMMKLITTHPSGRGGGKSKKHGNIKLNIKALINAAANGAFVIAGVIQEPILVPMAFIVLWSSLRNITEINLSDNDAGVIWAMWVYRDRDKNEISENELLDVINNHLTKYERAAITQKDLNHSLNNLVRINSIKRSRTSTDKWWLCEWISVKYK